MPGGWGCMPGGGARAWGAGLRASGQGCALRAPPGSHGAVLSLVVKCQAQQVLRRQKLLDCPEHLAAAACLHTRCTPLSASWELLPAWVHAGPPSRSHQNCVFPGQSVLVLAGAEASRPRRDGRLQGSGGRCAAAAFLQATAEAWGGSGGFGLS